MRSAREDDVPQLLDLWREEVAQGRQDIVPPEARLRRMLARFDWESKSRVVVRDGRLAGSVIVMSRPLPDGVLANVYAAGSGDLYLEMVRWGVDFCRAAGATVTQVFVGKGRAAGFGALGLRPVRPWWRMDRAGHELPRPEPAPGYELIDGTM